MSSWYADVTSGGSVLQCEIDWMANVDDFIRVLSLSPLSVNIIVAVPLTTSPSSTSHGCTDFVSSNCASVTASRFNDAST